jgi:hypothetical protein
MTVAVMAAAIYAAPYAASYMMYGTTAWASVATATMGGAMLTAASGAVIAGVGLYAANALVPVSQAAKGRSSASSLSASAAEDTVYSVSGMSNQLDPWGPIPLALGFVRWAPKHGARPYTEAAGSDQYIRALLDWGLGPLLIEDIQIGDTLLTDFAAEDGESVEVQTVQGFPETDPAQDIFTQDIYEDQISILLEASAAQIRTTGADADECSVDIAAQPLADWSGGSKATRTVNFTLEYRLHGSTDAWTNPDGLAGLTVELPDPGEGLSWYGVAAVNFDYGAVRMFWGGWSASEPPTGWLPVVYVRSWNTGGTVYSEITSTPAAQGWTGLTPSLAGNWLTVAAGTRSAGLTLSGATTQAIRTSRRLVFPARGRYDVRLTRTTAESTADSVYEDCYWSALRTITRQAPISVAWSNATTQLRVKATGRLAGTLDKLNGLTRTWCLDWYSAGSAWVAGATNNCASLYRWVLQCDFNPFPRTDAQIDLDALAEWHEFCEANGFAYNKVVNLSSPEKVRAVLSEIASAGRAIEVMVDGKWSVVIDQDRSDEMPVDFTAGMVWGVKVQRDFREAPHALRCPFINEDTWEDDEIIIPAPQYTSETAEIFEVYDQPGVTNVDARASHALYRLADMWLRRETFVFSTDFASMAIRGRGSLVTLAHWTVGTGLANGRVKSVASNAGTLYVTVDEPCLMSSGNAYRVLFRDVDAGTRGVRQVTTNPGLQTVLEIPAEVGGIVPAKGDPFAFGLEGLETRTLIVSSIVPGSAMSAQITAKDYVWPSIQEFLDGGAPEWTAQVTRSPWTAKNAPEAPSIRAMVSDETVMLRDATGALVPRIAVDYATASGLVATAYLQAQIREAGGTWSPSVSVAVGEALLLTGVETGETYGLRLRAVSAASVASAWTDEVEHEVVGGSTAPPAVEGLTVVNGDMVWSYDNEPVDFEGFLVVSHAGTRRVRADALPAHKGLLSVASYPLANLGSGVRSVGVVAVDRYRNESEPAWLTVNLGDPELANVVDTEDHGALGWPGEASGGYDVSGSLVASDASAFWLGEDANLIWEADEAHDFWSPQYAEMTYSVTYTPSEAARLTLGLTASGAGWSVLYREKYPNLLWTGDDDATLWTGVDDRDWWTAEPGAWQPWPGALDVVVQPYEFLFTFPSGSRRGTLSVLQFNLDVEDQVETVADVALAAGTGTRLPLAKSYREILNVTGMVVGDSGSAVSAVVSDLSVAGPLVKGLDGSRNVVAGVLKSATIKGVPA